MRARFALVALVAAAPALGLMGYTYHVERGRARADTFAENLRLTRLAADRPAGLLDGVQRLLRTIAETPGVEATDRLACNRWLERIVLDHPSYINVSIADADGTVLCAGAPLPSGFSMRGRHGFELAMQTRKTSLGEYQISATTGAPSIVVAYPLLSPSGDVRRVIAVALGLETFATMAKRAELPAGATLVLFDDHGTILARHPDGPRWVGKRVPDSWTVGRSAAAEAYGVDGVRRLYVTVPLESRLESRLYVGMGVDHATAFAETDRMAREFMMLLAFASLAAVVIAVGFGELFVNRPARMLTDVTTQLAAGDLTARARLSQGVPGLTGLADAVNRMAAALDARRRERDAYEAELRASEDRYRLLFDHNPHPMWVYDVDTLEFLEVNAAAERQYGYARDEFLTLRLDDLHVAAGDDAGLPRAGIVRHRRRCGSIVDVEPTSHRLTFLGRTASLVASPDVTDRTRAEAAIAERVRISALRVEVGAALNREAELAPCLQSCADAFIRHLDLSFAGIWMLGDDGAVTLQTRHPADDACVAGLPIERIAHDATPACSTTGSEAADGALSCAGHPLVFEGRVVGVLGVVAAHPLSAAVLGALAGIADHLALGITRHHTDQARQQLVASVGESEQRMRFALDAAQLGIFDSDIAGGARRWSAIMEAHHGLPPGGFGGTTEAFLACVHPDDRQEVADGFASAARDRVDAHVQYRTIWPDGTTHWIRCIGRYVYDESGAPVRAAGVGVDVTERRNLEEQLRQAQKMEAIGQLAGGIAHDFNNMLTAILGNAELLGDGLPAAGPQQTDVDEIRKAAKRAAALTHQLLAFSRKQLLAPRVLHLADVVGEVTPMLRRLIGERIELKTASIDAGRVKADSGQLQQVLMNLVVNARDAMPGGGRLTIETCDGHLDAAYVRRHPMARAGDYVILAVTDTGHGMDADTQSRIFEPFFTTKAAGEGTGLGLATVYGIVQQSGGWLSVYSEVGRGTTFKVYLPRTDEPADVQTVQAKPKRAAGSGTILVVEDEETIGRLVQKMLKRQGYTVHTANTPKQAIEYANGQAGPIDLLLSDVVLPGMCGPELAIALQSSHPEARVMFMSGYTEHAMIHQGVLGEHASFLPKPFTADALISKVRDALATA